MFFTTLFAKAQYPGLERKYHEKTVFLYGNQYMRDDQKLPKSGLAILLNSYPDSKNEYALSKKWGTIGGLINASSIALSFYGLYQYKENGRDMLPYFVASIATAYLSVPFMKKGRKHLHKSVWLYNKNVLVNLDGRL